MLHRHMDPTFLHVSTKIQLTATVTLQIITKYVPEPNMPLKCHICRIVHVQISENYVSPYTHTNLPQSEMSP